MLQALATLLFALVAISAASAIFLLLRNDWDAVCAALGLTRTISQPAPRPPRVRVNAASRAVMMRMDVPQKRAAA